ncbi:cytochrome d ubiquinol oxidase subunit II [Fulvimarina endophytica]|uniref:Cytochrome d ubiquinol oxidase subunit II n=1 Tax=Fulvimarina endophytica TaxID=2293836 RepID=A0A371X5P7_9HYPH|nr:cytochrome d ubiquinol oxidase subunit II [Fulvimarina endophytica]RFC64540.1 cytochrome d ubiquinol oxidase subunit II [Fulvimarina endophytica]
MAMDLTLVWAGIISLAIIGYVVLDGFDLGLGMLFAVFPKRRDRDVMMNSVAPVWDGNETWLVMGGGGLFAAFPFAYALILPALYIPIIAMLLALVFRGVAFEFRWKTERWRGVWDLSFIGGSALAAFAQGVTLGGLIQGIEVDLATRSYAGGAFDFLTPFSVLTGLSVMIGYMLLGATWLVMKTEGDLQARARFWSWVMAVGTVASILVVSLFTPYLEPAYFARWFTFPSILFAGIVPLAVAATVVLLFRSLHVNHHDYRPFFLSLGLFVLSFVGLGVSLYPYVVPPSVTIWDAAAPEASQIFMLFGAAVLLPLIVGYTAYAYWVFRGKIDPEEGYH